MSKKINYKFVAMPIQWLTSNNLSAQEKITLAVIMADSYIQKDGLYGCQSGYEEIGNKAGITGRHCKDVIKRLITMGYIEKTIRNNRRYSNNLRVCLENLAGDCQDEQGGTRVPPYAENREGTLKQSGGNFEAIGRELQFPLNKIQEDTRNTHACVREEKEPANVVAGRSRPSRQTGSESAMKADEASQCDIEDFLLIDNYKQRFKDYYVNICLLKIGNTFAIRPYPSFKFFDKIKPDLDTFFSENNRKIIYIQPRQHVAGEIIVA